ncbi:hypothetical protein [Zobellia laminariae]|uniref:hypothetical protein n=1 Tax=Zobellia laminariae TaxID=248906 RepID=UPI0026F426A8|nr:hypothetical protein [Zobellia laminariae]WKX76195.1 hypothetical protein Q5W13_21930 [Zobellia laminariae]
MQQTMEALVPSFTGIWQSYTMDIRQRSILGGVANENSVRAEVRKYYFRQNETGYIFSFEVTDRFQTNKEGIRAMENDIAKLQSELTVQTDFQGNPIRILNLATIRDNWKGYKKEFAKKHKEQKGLEATITATDSLFNNNKLFTENFRESEIGTLFFPDIYGTVSSQGETIESAKIFTDFFDTSSLPFLLTTTLKKRDRLKDTAQVFRKGMLDEENFDRYNVRKFFRKLADNIQLAVPVKAAYMETYDLDKNHHIGHAGQLLTANVPALFNYEQIVRIIPKGKNL